MDINVYCDETLPDLFTTSRNTNKRLLIGSLWIESTLKDTIKNKIKRLREEYNCWGEIKWTKVSPSKQDFYFKLIDLFFSYGEQVRFRCITVDPKQINWQVHNGDKELGFYKFYYFTLNKWISEFNSYNIFCDLKVNRDLTRLKTMKNILQSSNQLSSINRVQALPSKEVSLIQLSDLLLGATSSKINNIQHSSHAKIEFIQHLERHLGKEIAPTSPYERKFNIFNMQLQNRNW